MTKFCLILKKRQISWSDYSIVRGAKRSTPCFSNTKMRGPMKKTLSAMCYPKVGCRNGSNLLRKWRWSKAIAMSWFCPRSYSRRCKSLLTTSCTRRSLWAKWQLRRGTSFMTWSTWKHGTSYSFSMEENSLFLALFRPQNSRDTWPLESRGLKVRGMALHPSSTHRVASTGEDKGRWPIYRMKRPKML